MLVLKRKILESIKIGNDVIVTVLDIDGLQVKLGIQASPEVKILRTELLKEKRND